MREAENCLVAQKEWAEKEWSNCKEVESPAGNLGKKHGGGEKDAARKEEQLKDSATEKKERKGKRSDRERLKEGPDKGGCRI